MGRGASEAGLLDALTHAAASLFDALRHRLELAGIEIGEARARLVTNVAAGVAAALMLGGALALLTAWAAVAWWATLGPAVLGWLALAYALGGAALLGWLRHRVRSAPPLLAETLAELQRDAAALRGGREP